MEVHDTYYRYLQSENYRGLKDLPLAYRRIAEDLETLIEHKSYLKKTLEHDKKCTEVAISEMHKKIEVLNDYYLLSS